MCLFTHTGKHLGYVFVYYCFSQIVKGINKRTITGDTNAFLQTVQSWQMSTKCRLYKTRWQYKITDSFHANYFPQV